MTYNVICENVSDLYLLVIYYKNITASLCFHLKTWTFFLYVRNWSVYNWSLVQQFLSMFIYFQRGKWVICVRANGDVWKGFLAMRHPTLHQEGVVVVYACMYVSFEDIKGLDIVN